MNRIFIRNLFLYTGDQYPEALVTPITDISPMKMAYMPTSKIIKFVKES